MTFDLLTYTKGRVESQAKEFEVHLQGIANKLLRQARMNDAITSNGAGVFSTVIPSKPAINAMVDLNLDAHACLRALEDHFISMGISVSTLPILGPYDNQFGLTWSVESLEEAKKTKGGNSMTFDLLKYSEDKVKEIITVPDATLSTMFSALLDKVGAEADREGRFCLLTDENEVGTVLDSFNIPQAREAFYAYCERIGVDVFVYTLDCVMVRLQWTVQSLKDAKAESTGVRYNSLGEPLLPIGSVVTFIENSIPETRLKATIVWYRTFDEEAHADYYVVENKGDYRVVHYSEVTLVK
ncbi:gp29 [Brochothrix phage A9]|uniref:Gp29 n=1 Tax=Brochothrix phage A9 TaxID=857312 RepID=D9J0H6_9CAUD|nr:gp29 [Brochothrix phage A9]ADJ53071.1 gp29 [Brochothrix phage A9]